MGYRVNNDSMSLTFLLLLCYVSNEYYLFSVCFKGPSLMAKYPAFSIRPLIVVYNLFCAALNFYIGYEIFVTSRTISYSWTCQPVDYSLDPSAVRIARALWWYYISKLLELCGKSLIGLIFRKLKFNVDTDGHPTLFCPVNII